MPCIILGHEFLDALPVHLFKLDEERGWLEVLVDESTEPEDPHVRPPLAPPSQTASTAHG